MPSVVLPKPGDRWTPRRKWAVVEALRLGEITMGEAVSRYNLSREELAGWVSGYDRSRQNLEGLYATKRQKVSG